MAVQTVFLTENTTAYATDVMNLVTPLYDDLDPTNVNPASLTGSGDIFVLQDAPTINGLLTVTHGATASTGLIYAYSNSSNTGAKHLISGINDNTLAANAIPLYLQQDADDVSVLIAHDSTTEVINCTYGGSFLAGVSSATTQNAGHFITASLLTTGGIDYLYSNAADISARFLSKIENANVLAAGAIPLNLIQASTSPACQINSAGQGIKIVSTATIGNSGIEIQASSATTATPFTVYSNSPSTGVRKLGFIHNDDSAAVNCTGLYILQDAIAYAMQLESTTSGDTGSIIEYYHNSSTPTGGDMVADIQFNGNNSIGTKVVYVKLLPKIDSTTAGSENGNFTIQCNKDGTLSTVAQFRGGAGGGENRLQLSGNLGVNNNNLWDIGTNVLTFRDIYSNNAVTIISDERLKQDIIDCPLGMDYLRKFDSKFFKWKEVYKDSKTKKLDSEKRFHGGWISQDAINALPEGINFGGASYDKEKDIYNIRPTEFMAIHHKALRELDDRIAKLEALTH